MTKKGDADAIRILFGAYSLRDLEKTEAGKTPEGLRRLADRLRMVARDLGVRAARAYRERADVLERLSRIDCPFRRRAAMIPHDPEAVAFAAAAAEATRDVAANDSGER